METIKIPVIRVRQSEWDMYVGVIAAHDLYFMAEVDRIRLKELRIPKYAGYQRALIEDRVESIRDYLSTPDSTFPNTIIVSIDSEFIEEWNPINDEFELTSIFVKREQGAIRIIDGQHRCAALDAADDSFRVIVTMFVDLEIAKCARIFAKINSTQKSVNPSIAYQLFGYAEDRSPQKTGHDIAELLNTTDGSPFFKKLRMLGTRDDWNAGTLSQATFCKYLMQLYTKKPEQDENALLRGETLRVYEGYPLREFFIKNNDKGILEVIWRFFYNVANNWPEQWDDESGKSILVKTTGYTAFVQVLKEWLLGADRSEVIKDKGVVERLKKIKERYDDQEHRFTRQNYPAGSQGFSELRNKLLLDLELKKAEDT